MQVWESGSSGWGCSLRGFCAFCLPGRQNHRRARMNNGRLSFWRKVKGFLGAPANTFDSVEAESLGSALRFFAVWAAIYAILQTVFSYVLGGGILQTLWEWLGLGPVVVYSFNPAAFGVASL